MAKYLTRGHFSVDKNIAFMYNGKGIKLGDSMKIDISEIISTNHKSVHITTQLEADSLRFGTELYPYALKSPVDITISNEGKSLVHICGGGSVDVLMPCSRCLDDVDVKLDYDFDQKIDFNQVRSGTLDDLDEISFMEDDWLDVDRFVEQELITRLPMKVLCRPDCAGLCPVCGKNLNEGDCGCDRSVPDPRMSAVQDIFNQFKEV